MRATPRDRDRRAGDDPRYADNAGTPPNAVFSKAERARAAKAGVHGTITEGPLSIAVSPCRAGASHCRSRTTQIQRLEQFYRETTLPHAGV
jgi:hypothetical protein